MIEALVAGPWGPVFIFLLRLVDVPVSTIRTILLAKGHRRVVPFLAFFESLTWLVAVGSALANMTSPLHMLAYAAGFGAGNAVGMWLEGKLALGHAAVRILSRTGVEVAEALREKGFGATEFVGQGLGGRVELIYSVVRRRKIAEVLGVVSEWDPEAFVAVDETRPTRSGYLLARK